MDYGAVGFLGFPPTPKNQNPSILLVHIVSGLLLCVQAFLAALKFNHLAAPWEPVGS